MKNLLVVLSATFVFVGCGMFQKVNYDSELHTAYQDYKQRVSTDMDFFYDKERAAKDEVYALEFETRTDVRKDLEKSIDQIFEAQRKGK